MLARRLLLGSAAAAACSLLLALVVWWSTSGPTGPDPAPDPAVEPAAARAPDAVAVLAAWDERRARAWASGDVEALRRLYVDGSRTGHRDADMLGAWVERGLVVRGLRTQVISARVVRRNDRSLLLAVTDKAVGAVAVGKGRRVTLPADEVSAREIGLRRVRGRWLVAEVASGAGSGG